MFIDHAIITVRSGDGGNGCVSFRREKFVPKGGPDGGNGGKGGNIIFQADSSYKTLLDFRYRNKYFADRAEHGKGKNMHGKKASDLIIKVPCGTVVYDNETGRKIADLVNDNQSILICKGGRGGFGNARFTSSVNQSPRLAEKGQPGEEKKLRLELKLIADVGLVGFPNVGKSTLISKISSAHPKIANYPFTTLTPYLGVVNLPNWRTFVVADIPGLIEGAHNGAGLGDEFLRHVERTRILVHVLDMSGLEGRIPTDDFEIINNELRSYSDKLIKKTQIVVANKMDLPTARENFEKMHSYFKDRGFEIFSISGVTGEGLENLLKHIARKLDEIIIDDETEQAEEEIIEFTPRFNIKRIGNMYEISGKEVEKWIAMTDFDNEEAVERLQKIFKKIGIEDELKKMGAASNCIVKVCDKEFTYFND